KLIFVATAGGADRQTWLSDGTAAGTRPLFDNAAFLGYPVGSFNGKTFLLTPDASSGQNEYDLWTTDGTASGTIRLTGVLIPGASGVSLSAAGLYFVNSADGDA